MGEDRAKKKKKPKKPRHGGTSTGAGNTMGALALTTQQVKKKKKKAPHQRMDEWGALPRISLAKKSKPNTIMECHGLYFNFCYPIRWSVGLWVGLFSVDWFDDILKE